MHKKGRIHHKSQALVAICAIYAITLAGVISAQSTVGSLDSSPDIPPVTENVVEPDSTKATESAVKKASYQNTIGLYLQDVSPTIAWFFQAPDTKGAIVRWVREGSAADKAGLAKGDILREVEGIQVQNVVHASELIFDSQTDGIVQFSYLRDGEKKIDAALTLPKEEILSRLEEEERKNRSLYYYADIDYGADSGDRFADDPDDFNWIAARREALVHRGTYDGVDYSEDYNIKPDYSEYAANKLRKAEKKELEDGSRRTLEELRAWVAANREYLQRYHSYYGTPDYGYLYSQTGTDPGDGLVDVNKVDQVAPPDDVDDDVSTF